MNVFACAVTPCKVQRGCYTTLKAKRFSMRKRYSCPTFSFPTFC